MQKTGERKISILLTFPPKIPNFNLKSGILMTKYKYPLLILVTVFISFNSCKKIIEGSQKNAFLEVMTNGYWHVESYTEGTTNGTDLFSGYNFKFVDDGTVEGINCYNSTKGIWVGDIENYTISSTFPAAEDPLKRLNGIWKITNTKPDFVNAEMTTNQGKMVLQLRKS